MKQVLYVLAIFLFYGCSSNSELVDLNFKFADKQIRVMLDDIDDVLRKTGKKVTETPSPRNLQPDGSMRIVQPLDWCSGFFPGILWYMYEYTQDPYWKEKAQTYTEYLESLRFCCSTHDLGFMLYCSYGNGWRLTHNEEYKKVLLDGAESLSSRFNSKIGCIRSWDSGDNWQYPVIIDNMMNLEFLFWASKVSGNQKYKDIAIKHADTTMRNHFRNDFSSYHVIDYDTITGEVKHKHTHQGYAHESAWARGQSWGLYGFTMCYRETKDLKYLELAENIAEFILNHPHLPKDLIPYWDFDAPEIPNVPRDVSAAAIMASALYELSLYSDQGRKYRKIADQIINNLSTNYRQILGEKHGFLLHSSTGHMPAKSEINVPIIYADYYYIEALLRKKNLDIKGQ